MSILQVEHIVRDKIDAYEDECDLWKADHERAMVYFRFCDLLRDGIQIFHDICRLDENWRLGIFKGNIPYDASFDGKIRSLVDRFYRTTISIERDVLPAFETQFGAVEHAVEFRSVCKDILGMMSADDEFFKDDALLTLRDRAIEDDERGSTVEYDLV
jgi:hypothetical protein